MKSKNNTILGTPIKNENEPKEKKTKSKRLMERDLLPTETSEWIREKIMSPKDHKSRIFRLGKKLPAWKAKTTPYEWLYELFWSEIKISEATHMIDPDEHFIDIGPG